MTDPHANLSEAKKAAGSPFLKQNENEQTAKPHTGASWVGLNAFLRDHLTFAGLLPHMLVAVVRQPPQMIAATLLSVNSVNKSGLFSMAFTDIGRCAGLPDAKGLDAAESATSATTSVVSLIDAKVAAAVAFGRESARDTDKRSVKLSPCFALLLAAVGGDSAQADDVAALTFLAKWGTYTCNTVSSFIHFESPSLTAFVLQGAVTVVCGPLCLGMIAWSRVAKALPSGVPRLAQVIVLKTCFVAAFHIVPFAAVSFIAQPLFGGK